AKALCRAKRKNILVWGAVGRCRARMSSRPLRLLRVLCAEVSSFGLFMRRIGIDVGGTNTDAVLLEDSRVVHAAKTPTTEDVTSGVTAALRALLQAGAPVAVDAVMIGTTHFTNAVVQRRDLTRVAAIR